MPAANSVTMPAGVMRPIRATFVGPPVSVNHMFPSGPLAMPDGPEPGVIPVENSVITPAGVMRPMRSPQPSVNQRLPSGPAAIPVAWLVNGAWAVIPPENSVIVPASARGEGVGDGVGAATPVKTGGGDVEPPLQPTSAARARRAIVRVTRVPRTRRVLRRTTN